MNSKKYVAEVIGTFWLVLGGCGSAVLAAGLPGRRHRAARRVPGLRPDRRDHGLRHRPHLGLPPQPRSHGRADRQAVVSRLRTSCPTSWPRSSGAVIAGAVLYVIASGAPGFDLAKGFASNGYAEHSPGGYSLLAALVTEVVMTAMFLFIIMGATHGKAPVGLRAARDRPRPDPDPPDLDPRHQHLGQPGPQHRRRGVRRRVGRGPALAVLGGAVARRCYRWGALPLAARAGAAHGHGRSARGRQAPLIAGPTRAVHYR